MADYIIKRVDVGFNSQAFLPRDMESETPFLNELKGKYFLLNRGVSLTQILRVKRSILEDDSFHLISLPGLTDSEQMFFTID